MVSKMTKIVNPMGMHMRPAGMFAQEMMKFNSDVMLVFNDKEINAKSIMNLMDTITQVEISEEEYPLTAEGGMELLRADEERPSMPAEEVLANAKGKLYHFIAVQKLMD